MQQHQQLDMPPFSAAGGACAASPISSRPPQAYQFDENGVPSGNGSGFDHEGLTTAEEGERGGSAGNRWPRQETLALLKIRSEMDADFRDATLKGPLWEEVSRKLSELGYRRSAKKCREKFENVDKYYKRTKDSRAGRNDGKAYRFFSQLEALHGATATTAQPPVPSLAPPPVAVAQPTPPTAISSSSMATPPLQQPVGTIPMPATATAGMMTVGDVSFSTDASESDEDASEGAGMEETGSAKERGKRKRRGPSGGASGSDKMTLFFEGLMKQVMERQEAMQKRFLEAVEKREQDRMIREEAWRRQEMARLAREQETLMQERAMAASRDAAVISFIQKITGRTVPLPSITAPAITVMPPPSQPTPVASAAPSPLHPQPQPQAPQPQKPPLPATSQPQRPKGMDIVTVTEPQDTSGPSGYDGSGGSTPSSRWPKAEVHALIQIRTNLETRYQDAAPKGPLWEEISASMRRIGYNRSAKRCKEKWENINKYFKKVKESNKKRPEDSKTCPYYHQLDALYRSKASCSSGGVVGTPRPPEHGGSDYVAPSPEVVTVAAVPLSQTAPQAEPGAKNCSNGNGNGCGSRGCADGDGSSGGMQRQASNGSVAARFSVGSAGAGAAGMGMNKPEDMMKETIEHSQPAVMNSHHRMDSAGSDSMDDEEDNDFDDDDDEDDINGSGGKMQYEIQFQRQQQNAVRPPHAVAGVNPPGTSAPGTAATTTTSGSFLAMVQ